MTAAATIRRPRRGQLGLFGASLPSSPPPATSDVDTAGPWTLTIPGLRLKNPMNGAMGHTRIASIIRSSERKKIRATVRAHVEAIVPLSVRTADPDDGPAVRVQVTRIAIGTLDAWDGLPAACKPVIDGIADAFGARDDHPRFTWQPPAQEKRGRGVYAVVIRIELAEVPR